MTELRKAGSWTGRIHVHKLLYVIKEIKLANPPFEFELYQYGPYSRDLDTTFILMEAEGKVACNYVLPGYGPKYEVPPSRQCRLGSNDANAVERVAKEFGNRNSRDLELIATCLWVETVERPDSDASIVSRVQVLKPKYDVADIEKALRDAKAIRQRLCSNAA